MVTAHQPDSDEGHGANGDRVPRLSWLGHASVLVEMDGVRVVTDPALTDRLAHLRRHHHVDPSTVGRVDVVLISHVHLDHLHVPSLRMLGRDVLVIVPAGAASFMRRRGFPHVRETTAGQTTEIGGLTIETVPALHSGQRGPHSRVSVDAVGYVLRGTEGSVYFPGDTDLFPEMESLEDIDVALFPVGGWGPFVGEGHLDPRRAVQAMELVQPRLVVPIHWGTYSPLGLRRGEPPWLRDPLERFQVEMAGIGAEDRLAVVEPGGALLVPAASVDHPTAPVAPHSVEGDATSSPEPGDST